MVVGTKVCELTDGFLWFVCGLYVGILTSSLITPPFSLIFINGVWQYFICVLTKVHSHVQVLEIGILHFRVGLL